MFSLYDLQIISSCQVLADLPQGKLLINTINAHSFNVAQNDALFAEALMKGDVLLADECCACLPVAENPFTTPRTRCRL